MAGPRESLRVVIATSEAVPFSKTGGLADVAGALAKALDQLGHDVTLFVPDYFLLRENNTSLPPIVETGLRFSISMNGRPVSGTVNWTTLPNTGVRVLLIRQPEYFDRRQLYVENGHEYKDNCERFAFFSRAVLETCRQMILRPDVIHCNDWQTGIINGLLQTQFNGSPGFERTASIMTLHNMAYQGRFWHFDLPLTGMDWKHFNHNQMEAWGDLNLLKTGIAFADQITTVSPTYAKEICTPDGGYGLEGLLSYRRDDLVGILNGIDEEVWNPETDQHIPQGYSIDTVGVGKPHCKAHLQNRMHLEPRADVPLLGMISRMVDQKGFDLITGAADRILSQDLQMVFLGTGDALYERQLRDLAGRYPGRVAVEVGFDDSLAHQIEAGADIFLMPSRFEPCGLNQMYSLRYGTVPIVRNIGGLANSVENYEPDVNPDSIQTATGFVFTDYSKDLLAETIERAVSLYRQPRIWTQLVRNGMSRDWSWKRSALEYVAVYRKAMQRRLRRSP
ncbi:MAG TPA: glycogen synthase GlgA [Planctomycetaceae bacterium]|nr:glycogen synthase GlgA [Planctomycetaceae bacterium]